MKGLIRVTAVFLLLIIALLAGWVGSGWGDPQPLGALTQVIEPGTMVIPEGGDRVMSWLETGELGGRFSVRLTAVFQSGERDIGYGLLLGSPQTATAIKLSPLGYLTIQQSPISNSQSPISILPWQTWPHVRPDRNEIWVDVDKTVLTVRVNRELLWVGELVEPVVRVGVVGEGFGEETAVVAFPILELFQQK